MTPTLTDNTVRIPIKPAVPEDVDEIVMWRPTMVRGYKIAADGIGRNFTGYETHCPHPPGSKIKVRERCEVCDGTSTMYEGYDRPLATCDYCEAGEITRTVTVRSVSVDGDCWVLEVE